MEKQIKIYALSTCIWCKKTVEYFKKKGIKHVEIFVDLLESPEKERVAQEVEKLNPKQNFPTIVINDTIIVGYDTAKFEEALSK